MVLLGRLIRLQQATADSRPALVNLAVTKCAPTVAAYEATILDLAERGYLLVSEAAEGLWVTPRELLPADLAGLADYERQVLGDVRARLTGTGNAPLAALTQACEADVSGTWESFSERLRAQGWRLGISRPRIPQTGRMFLLAVGITALIAVLTVVGEAYLVAPGAHPVARLVVPAVISICAFWIGLGWLGNHDRLTPLGSALAARWRPAAEAAADPARGADPGTLHHRAFALAAGHASAVGLEGKPAKSARPSQRSRPQAAWSTLSGAWREVPIGNTSSLGMGAGFALLGGALWAVLMAYLLTLSNVTKPYAVLALIAMVALAVLGIRRIARMAAIPRRHAFDGQVIARWTEESDNENGGGSVYYVAVDDGVQAWTFSGQQVFARVALGDLARVTVNPRTGSLEDFTISERPRAAEREAVGETLDPLLTGDEVATIIGPVSSVAGVLSSGTFTGRDGSLIVVLMSGRIAAVNVRHARRVGSPLPGIGDGAWLRNGGRVVVTAVGDQALKLILSSRAPRQNLPALAATAASRLAGRSESRRTGAGDSQAAELVDRGIEAGM
jgi:hypothetical protein